MRYQGVVGHVRPIFIRLSNISIKGTSGSRKKIKPFLAFFEPRRASISGRFLLMPLPWDR
jgi:hypothetical protein